MTSVECRVLRTPRKETKKNMGVVKHIVKWVLNHVPRVAMQRMAEVAVPVLGLFCIGRGRECPICGARRRRFLPYGYVKVRENALCPKCLSLERHRLLWLWLQRETTFLEGSDYPVLLHIAPEVCLKRKFEERYVQARHGERYITADLESPLARLHFDVQAIPLADESIDVLICNHLLEHVENEGKALAEFRRILRRGGWGILLAPVDLNRETTDEDDGTATPEERTRRFGQYDHHRAYGRDYAERLRRAGFRVEDIDYAAQLSAEERERYALCGDHIYKISVDSD